MIHLPFEAISMLHMYIWNFYLFIYFGLYWILSVAHRLFLVVLSRGYSSLWCVSSLSWLPLLQSMRLWLRVSFSSCSTWAQWLQFSDSRVQAQKLWCTSLVATQHAGSSQPKDRTPVSCIGWQILCHWAPGEAGDSHSLKTLKVCLVCT